MSHKYVVRGVRGKGPLTVRSGLRLSHGAFIACVLVVLCEVDPARADDSAATPGEQVTVRGEAGGGGGDAASGFVSRRDVDREPREITDAASLVEPMPGVHVRRLGGDDAFATLSVRGSGSNQVSVVLAGVPLTGGADPTLDLATLPLWPGARARVYRSFAPASLGPGSLGGTLAVDAPHVVPGAPDRTAVWAAGGSFGEARMRVADVRSDAGVVTALSASRADDDFSYFDPRQGHLVPRANAGHAAVNGLVAVEQGPLRVTTLAQARRQELPGSIESPTPTDRLDSTRLVESLELALPSSFLVRAWGRRDDLHLRSDTTPFGTAARTRTDETLSAFGGAFGWRGRAARALSIDARVDASAERFAPGSFVGVPEPAGARRVQTGIGIDAEARATDALTIAAAGRIDGYDDEPDAIGAGAGSPHGELRPTGHAGVDMEVAPGLDLVAHGGAVARPASFVERFGDNGGFLGNPDLKSERAFTADAGARAAGRAGPLRVGSELDAFGTWAEDLVTFDYVGAGNRLKATNVGRARILGAEADVLVGIAGAEARVAYTLLATADETRCASVTAAGPACERPDLPGRPTHDLVADVAYALGPVRVRWGVDAVSGEHADLTGAIAVPARVLQSAGVRVDVPRVAGLRIALDVRNLFDVRTGTYEGALGPERLPIGDAYDYPLPGRTVLVSARWLAVTDVTEADARRRSSTSRRWR